FGGQCSWEGDMKLLRTTPLTAALMTAAVVSISSPAQAQLAWWGWPGLPGNPYPTAYGYYPGYGYGYGTGYNYPDYAYGYQYQPYSSSGGYGMWENPWYSAASHPFIRRHIPLWARATSAGRHWR